MRRLSRKGMRNSAQREDAASLDLDELKLRLN